jgi:hypothetical protein
MNTGTTAAIKSNRIATGLTDDTAGSLPPPDRMICACAEMDFAGLEQAVGKLRNESFETLLKETGSGNTCTACLLDLEYYFVALKSRPQKKQTAVQSSDDAGVVPRQPFKQRVYALLDAISPPVAWAPPNRIPLVMGRGIETWLTVTNHDLLFRDRKTAPLTTSVVVRRDDGKRLWRGKFEIEPGRELKVRLDQHLQPGDAPLSVGSARVSSRARHPAMRGTMRPQLEILAPAGTCALHGQGDDGPGDTWFTVQNRPQDQRLFLIVMNNATQAQTAFITLPYEVQPTGITPELSAQLTLPPNGTGLHEILLPDPLAKRIGEAPFAIRTKTERACRVFLVCATPALDRFSIDHR